MTTLEQIRTIAKDLSRNTSESYVLELYKQIISLCDKAIAEESQGISLVREERNRQVSKGYDAQHDDTHTKGELVGVAEAVIHVVMYPHHPVRGLSSPDPRDPGNWHEYIIHKWRHDDVRMLTIAVALLVAEIERLERLKRAITPKPKRKGKTS